MRIAAGSTGLVCPRFTAQSSTFSSNTGFPMVPAKGSYRVSELCDREIEVACASAVFHSVALKHCGLLSLRVDDTETKIYLAYCLRGYLGRSEYRGSYQ
jgi:hypothetical protein